MPLFEPTALIVIAMAALAFVVAGLAFVGHELLAARDSIARRVAVLVPARVTKPAEREFAPASTRKWHIGAGTLPKRVEREIVLRLERFHVPADRAIAAFFALRVTIAIVLGACLAVVVLRRPEAQPIRAILVAPAAILAGWFLPQYVLSVLASRRSSAIERGLPNAIELLVVAVEAGLSLEDGIDRIVSELKRSQPILAAEFALTSADLKILPNRDVALANMADRIALPSVRSIVTTLSQTMRYGTPLVQALRVVAAELRSDSLVKLEERANRMPVLLTIPMIVFILPAVFLVVGGPSFLRLIDIFVR